MNLRSVPLEQLLCLAVTCLAPLPAYADIWKCREESGAFVYKPDTCDKFGLPTIERAQPPEEPKYKPKKVKPLSAYATPVLSDSDERTLLYACMERTKLGLNDPDSAQFSLVTAPRSVKRLGNSIYRVRFEGRAKNAFGALMVGTFECGVLLSTNGNATAIGSKQIR